MQTNITVRKPLLQSAAIAIAFGIIGPGTIKPAWGTQGEITEGAANNALQEQKMVKLGSKRDHSIKRDHSMLMLMSPQTQTSETQTPEEPASQEVRPNYKYLQSQVDSAEMAKEPLLLGFSQKQNPTLAQSQPRVPHRLDRSEDSLTSSLESTPDGSLGSSHNNIFDVDKSSDSTFDANNERAFKGLSEVATDTNIDAIITLEEITSEEVTPDVIMPSIENGSDRTSTAPETRSPVIEWDDLEIDISDSLSSTDQSNRLISAILSRHLANGEKLSFSSGFNRFSRPEIEPIVHVPLTLTWEGNINDVGLALGGGLDIYNRLPVDTHLNAKASVPVWPGATLSVSVEEGPYLVNSTTVEQGISAWRYGPELYWQIDPKTSFFSLLRLGHFNDGNFERQSFSRLERKLGGGVEIAAALLTWNFQQDLEDTSGYFSPTDFLVGSLELSWETDITQDLHCRVAASLGEQKNQAPWGLSYGHQALCSVDLTPGIVFDVGYSFQNSSDRQSFLSDDSTYNNLQIMGSLQATF